jgi:CxxC motif-containing protein (DUF1111 family)
MLHLRLSHAVLNSDCNSGLTPFGGRRVYGVALCALGLCLLALAFAPMLVGAQAAPPPCQAQPCDPGVRGGPPGAGGSIAGLTPNQIAFFKAGLARFNEVDSVSATIADEAGKGLGPRFNLNQCAGCHAQPAPGGSSPSNNPQPDVAHDAAAGCANDRACNPEDLSFTFLAGTQFAQPFISASGPVREARFVTNPDGTPDGGVHDLFTIAGRSDAPGCQLAQPDFNSANVRGNLVARTPTPAFGAGLIAAIQDSTIIDNQLANSSLKQTLGIHGEPNREGNAGTITRFGWKAQNKSIEVFAGEAYLVEQGVSNEVFPNERGEPSERAADGRQRVEPPPACLFNGIPEDSTVFDATTPTGPMSDTVGFAVYMDFLAPPQPVPLSESAQRGQTEFNAVGCTMCHTPTLQTGTSAVAALNKQTVNLYSDLLVHHIGSGLADNVTQGAAGGDQFRTAPLWGLGQRIFFLHDGRTTDLLQAIEQHASPGSEANAVITAFNALPRPRQQAILNFLRSL